MCCARIMLSRLCSSSISARLRSVMSCIVPKRRIGRFSASSVTALSRRTMRSTPSGRDDAVFDRRHRLARKLIRPRVHEALAIVRMDLLQAAPREPQPCRFPGPMIRYISSDHSTVSATRSRSKLPIPASRCARAMFSRLRNNSSSALRALGDVLDRRRTCARLCRCRRTARRIRDAGCALRRRAG